MSDLAKKVLLIYCQSWGQTVKERIDILNKAVKEAGIKAIFTQEEKNGVTTAGWNGESEETEKAKRFREELEFNWMKGNFEEEEIFIDSLINKYKEIQP